MKTYQERAKHILSCVIAVAVIFAVSPEAQAGVYTWNGAGSNWFDAANWGDGTAGVPGDNDTVFIGSGLVSLTGATARLASFVITNATLTFSDTTNLTTSLRATEVTLLNLGVLTHVINSDTQAPWCADARVYILCSNLTINAGGKIDVTGKGYKHGQMSSDNGCGPGGGTYGANTFRSGGGGHGGKGGGGAVTPPHGVAGVTNGSYAAPENPGSGGGAVGALASAGSAGDGGGVVRVEADGQVAVYGAIVTDGQTPPPSNGAGGAGGSIYISCRTFAGTGILAAKGGASALARQGGGGGGRIAVVYDTAAQVAVSPQPTVSFLLRGGNRGVVDGGVSTAARPGTLYLPDTRFFPASWTELNADMSLYIPVLTNWSAVELVVSNAIVTLPLVSTFSLTHNLTLTAISDVTFEEGATVIVGGNLILTNASKLSLAAAATNGVLPGYGGIVQLGGTLVVATNSILYLACSPTNGGAVFIFGRDCRIDAGGVVSANGLGFAAGNGSHLTGYGPGGGPYHNAWRAGGGGHGGKGGRSNAATSGGVVNGNANMPALPGSGGPAINAGPAYEAGGGVIWMRTTGDITINGTVTANGTTAGVDGGGGAGGSIWLDCHVLNGGGVICANGGAALTSKNGGGGGGRIAVWERVSQPSRDRIIAGDLTPAIIGTSNTVFAGVLSVNNGAGYDSGIPAEYSQPGTIVFLTERPRGTMILVR